jgi:hypothetical protein
MTIWLTSSPVVFALRKSSLFKALALYASTQYSNAPTH